MVEEAHKAKIWKKLLPNYKNMKLQREPKNSLTRLLAMADYLKLKRRFLGEGTQQEPEKKINVNGKMLSKILLGKRYMGGKDRKGARKSQPVPTAVKPPEEAEGKPTKKSKRVVISSSSSRRDED